MHYLFAIALLCAPTFSAVGQAEQYDPKCCDAVEHAIRNVEAEVVAALGRNDAEALELLWAPDYTFVNPGGALLSKSERLASLRSGDLRLESVSIDEMTIRIYGSTAVVIYRSTVKGERAKRDISSQRRVTSVLVENQGHWKVVSQQSTRLRR